MKHPKLKSPTGAYLGCDMATERLDHQICIIHIPIKPFSQPSCTQSYIPTLMYTDLNHSSSMGVLGRQSQSAAPLLWHCLKYRNCHCRGCINTFKYFYSSCQPMDPNNHGDYQHELHVLTWVFCLSPAKTYGNENGMEIFSTALSGLWYHTKVNG